MKDSRLLCICNGHGEDVIATRILAALHRRATDWAIAALPLVGTGHPFRDQNIPLICTTKQLPSGGFIYMDSRQLAQDLKGGLVQLTLTQIRAMGTWTKSGGMILAVGDLVPLLFAWWSGQPYWFVGTAKSDYYLRDETGLLSTLPWSESWFKKRTSRYFPWERWLMGHPRCLGVVVRDRLTADRLQELGIAHVHTGNPMMDDLAPTDKAPGLAPPQAQTLTVVLLPGSRAPEAYGNWQLMVTALTGVMRALAPQPVHFLGAIAPALDLDTLAAPLIAQGWVPTHTSPYAAYACGEATLQFCQDAYADCLHLADCAIAMAGTATEQVVGLGKPAFTLPGKGPQFNPQFAESQTRLLGLSVTLVPTPAAVGPAIKQVMGDPSLLAQMRENGRHRLGEAGAAERIAAAILHPTP
ncbi:MAG: lipid-A-disaccharide synthase-related protein [Cyanobacteria bacterium]|nr:lipid-A-disaccharide synthase-related protein [Cyanobacteriota bacterium]